jgi:membrane protease YdiL (CAAX protease family)
VYQSYKRRYRPLVAALISSVLFASLHINLQAFVPILLMGLLLAWLYQRTGSLLPGTLAHGLNNAVVFSAFYLFAA